MNKSNHLDELWEDRINGGFKNMNGTYIRNIKRDLEKAGSELGIPCSINYIYTSKPNSIQGYTHRFDITIGLSKIIQEGNDYDEVVEGLWGNFFHELIKNFQKGELIEN